MHLLFSHDCRCPRLQTSQESPDVLCSSVCLPGWHLLVMPSAGELDALVPPLACLQHPCSCPCAAWDEQGRPQPRRCKVRRHVAQAATATHRLPGLGLTAWGMGRGSLPWFFPQEQQDSERVKHVGEGDEGQHGCWNAKQASDGYQGSMKGKNQQHARKGSEAHWQSRKSTKCWCAHALEGSGAARCQPGMLVAESASVVLQSALHKCTAEI